MSRSTLPSSRGSKRTRLSGRPEVSVGEVGEPEVRVALLVDDPGALEDADVERRLAALTGRAGGAAVWTLVPAPSGPTCGSCAFSRNASVGANRELAEKLVAVAREVRHLAVEIRPVLSSRSGA